MTHSTNIIALVFLGAALHTSSLLAAPHPIAKNPPIHAPSPARVDVPAFALSHPLTGYYRLKTRGPAGMIADVFNFGKGNGSKVIGWNEGQTPNQRWKVEEQEDGSYKICAYSGQNSTQVLEVPRSLAEAGKPIALWDDDNTPAQRWYFQDVGDGDYRIIPKIVSPGVDLTLEVQDGKRGNSLALAPYSGGDHQVFRLEDFGPLQPRTATYRITRRGHPELSLAATGSTHGASAALDTTGDGANQRWHIERQDDGSYKVRANSNQVLDLVNGVALNGNFVRTWQESQVPAPSQVWYLKEVGGGYYRIISKASGSNSDQTLEVQGGLDAAAGSGLDIFPYAGADNQVFFLDDLDAR